MSDRPLLKPIVAEHRYSGTLGVLGGIVLGGVGLVIDGVAKSIAAFVIAVVWFAFFQFAVVYRAQERGVLDAPPPPEGSVLEPDRRTRLAAVRHTLVFLLFMVGVGLLLDTMALSGGIMAGGGVAMLVAARRLEGRAREYGATFVRANRRYYAA